MIRVIALILVFLAASAQVAFSLPFTLTPYSGNPVITYSGGAAADSFSTTDSWVGKSSNGTYYVVYSGVSADQYQYSLMVASAPSINGPWTKLGTLLAWNATPTDLRGVDGGVFRGVGDPFVLHDGTKWHLWCSAIPTEVTTSWQTVGARVVAHFTNTASSATFPMTGWVTENSRAVVGLTTGWTSDGAGHPSGVASPKVFPKDGGGWIMFVNNWMHTADSVGGKAAGYATASSLDGPWTLSSGTIVGSLNAQAPWTGQYQAEQLGYFKHGSKHYMLCNRSSLTTQAYLIANNAYDVSTDLWEADSQTGPYKISKLDAFTTQSWFYERGVVTLVNDNLLTPPDISAHPVEAVFQGRGSGGHFSLGAMTITQKTLCLGDSITYGQISGGGRLTTPYPTALGNYFVGAAFTNAGVPGETTAQMRTRWDSSLKTGGYSQLVLLGGINDIGLDVSAATSQANLEYMWTDAQSRGMAVVAVTLMPWRDETYGYWNSTRQSATESLNAWIKTRAAQLGIAVLDAYLLFGGEGGDPALLRAVYDSGDHIHPSQAGADLLALSLRSYVVPQAALTLNTAVSRATMSASFR